MQYKIGELASLLGIPAETLRFYEQKGLITPTRDENSGYRFFDTEDFFRLLIIKSLRGFEFTISEVLAIMNEREISGRINIMENKRREFKMIIEKYQALYSHAENYIEALENVEQDLWKCRVEDSPGRYAYTVMENQYTYKGTKGLNAMNRRWMDFSPFPQISIGFKMDSLVRHFENRPFSWGFSLSEDDARRLGVDTEDPVEYWPPRKSVCTVFAVEKGAHPFDGMGHLFDYMKANNLEVAGDALGMLVCQSYSSEEPTGYYRVWVPVR